jgi:pyruvate,water dikinase
MKIWIPLDEMGADAPVDRVGGKALSLARLRAAGCTVPDGGCVPSDVYRSALATAGFRERLELELHRKPFAQMRWEELWDAALRIRSFFLKLPLPDSLRSRLAGALDDRFGDRPVAVRSSAPSEDAAEASFAGLHESFVDVRGVEEILKSIRLVWASLWSDRALLYRQELGLDVSGSAMAVVIQEFVAGDYSGVAFTENPLDVSQGIVEAIAGRGQEFVDGAREPDRWILFRETGSILSKQAAGSEASGHSLSNHSVEEIFGQAFGIEQIFGAPQDVEWTLREDALHVLQARPITTRAEADAQSADKRPWYLGLHRKLPELHSLESTIRDTVLPGMARDADRFGQQDLRVLSDAELASALREREDALQKWTDAYWDYCIPFAHGMRLFGQVYNDRLQPRDPYEFVAVLSGESLISLERNDRLEEIGRQIAASRKWRDRVNSGQVPEDGAVLSAVDRWLADYGETIPGLPAGEMGRLPVLQLGLRLAERPKDSTRAGQSSEALVERFLSSFPDEDMALAEDLLRIGRASYALRDNDNHFLDRVQATVSRARSEIDRRIAADPGTASRFPKDTAAPAESAEGISHAGEKWTQPSSSLRGKQLVGQPSSPGVATGKARVIRQEQDLFAVEEGEVLVCDAISPAMTFAVPLAAAIVERRGGMLIHGAIIAREYGIPCVTGVARATELIHDGQTVTVDGHLGLVAIRVDKERRSPAPTS